MPPLMAVCNITPGVNAINATPYLDSSCTIHGDHNISRVRTADALSRAVVLPLRPVSAPTGLSQGYGSGWRSRHEQNSSKGYCSSSGAQHGEAQQLGQTSATGEPEVSAVSASSMGEDVGDGFKLVMSEKLWPIDDVRVRDGMTITRRQSTLGMALVAFTASLGLPPPPELRLDRAEALQGMTAGRVPGLSGADENGLRTYRRPQGKSGGHGVGWSEMIPYSFKVPEQWEEVPVSIADLGGTEIDLRLSSKMEGDLAVVVAPVLRFAEDLGNDATIEKVGDPQKVILAFGPEITGENVEGKVRETTVRDHDGIRYYQYYLEAPQHLLVSITAAGNRLYIFSIKANGRQWKRAEESLRQINESFRVG